MGLGITGAIALIGVALLALPLLVGAVFVILIVSNRADPDPSGRRPSVVYSYAVSFITLFVTLFATFEIVAALTSLIGSHHTARNGSSFTSGDFISSSSGAGPKHPFGDSVARGVVIGVLIAIVAGIIYLIHVRAAQRATTGVLPAEPAGRVRLSYTAAVSFICVMIVVVSLIVSIYQVFRILGPGVFNSSGSGSRIGAFRTMLPLLYLAAASAALLLVHIRQLPPEARPSFMPPSAPRPGPIPDVPPVVAAPLKVEVEVLDVGPPPRKRAPQKRAPRKAPAKKT
jgi:heme/copper-type cytochrome/quinol oxidase subunit 2